MGSRGWVLEIEGEQHKIRGLHEIHSKLMGHRGELTVWVDGEIIYELRQKNFLTLKGSYPLKIGNTVLVLQVRPPRPLSTQYRVFLAKDGKRIPPF